MTGRKYTDEQSRVIHHGDSHAVVTAVAGSGKTETLVGRVGHLLRDHRPEAIAVVMFNRDAKDSFQKRFSASVGTAAPEIRTFNSMGNKLVNRFVQQGLLPEAQIIEKDYRRSKIAREVFTRVFKRLHGDDMHPDKELVDGFLSFILLVKSDVKEPEDVFELGRYGKLAGGYVDAFKQYEAERVRLRLRFFEDQIYDPVIHMLKHPESQRYVADKVDHLIVDEAQDMNGIQIALLKMLAGSRAKVMLVGDEDQAIYEWRGAKPGYLVRGFERDFQGSFRYSLPHTFRFGHTLSLAASQLISRNKNRTKKISISAEGTPETKIYCLSLALGLTGLGEYIKSVIDGGRRPDEIAVLVRTYSLSVSLELELHMLRIPYYVYGRPPLSKIPEISALIGVLVLASDRWDSMSADARSYCLRSLLQRPSLYLDQNAVDQIVHAATRNPDKLSAAIRGVITPAMKEFQAEQIRDRADLLEIIGTATAPDEKVTEILDRYLSGSNFEKSIEKQSASPETCQAVLANVEAFKLIASRHRGTVAEFLDEIDPLIDLSQVDPPDTPHVWIGSIHRAKGAQWPVVFIPGLSAKSFPRETPDKDEIEAERRLFYVGMTRAVDALYLAHPSDASFKQSEERADGEPISNFASSVSQFLWESDLGVARHAASALESKGPFQPISLSRPDIPNEYFRRFNFASTWSYAKRSDKEKAVEAQPDSSELPPGTKVFHHAFGSGRVDRWIDHKVIRVIFNDGETKLLVAAIARLKVEQRF